MLPTKVFAILAIFLVASALATPVPEDSSDETGLTRVPRGAKSNDKKSSKKEGVILHFRHKRSKINVQVQLKTKDGYHEVCLRIFHDKFTTPAKPCFGIKHKKNADDTSSLPYRFRLNRLTLYTGEIKLKKKITTCKNIDLLVISERVCFKDFKFHRKDDKKHGRVTEICIKLGFKNVGRTFEVCGSFKGKKLVNKSFKGGKYVPQEIDEAGEDLVTADDN